MCLQPFITDTSLETASADEETHAGGWTCSQQQLAHRAADAQQRISEQNLLQSDNTLSMNPAMRLQLVKLARLHAVKAIVVANRCYGSCLSSVAPKVDGCTGQQ